MPAETLRWDTLEALKNSPKGKLRFDSRWAERGEDILAGYKEVLSLSPRAGDALQRLSAAPRELSCFQGCGAGESSPSVPEEAVPALSTSSSRSSEAPGREVATNNGVNAASVTQLLQSGRHGASPADEAEADAADAGGPASPTALSLLSPKAMETAGCIIMFEEEKRAKAKMALRQRQEMQEKMVAQAASTETEQLKRFEELTELKQRQEYQSMRDTMDRETKETMGRQEKLKEEQRHRRKIVNLRLREAEQQRLREAELERQRQAEGRERVRSLNSIQEEILRLNQLLEPSALSRGQLPADSLSSFSSRGNQLCSQLSEVVRKTAEGDFPSAEDMTAAERALHDMRALIRLMQADVAKAREEEERKRQEEEEGRRKLEELKAQQEAQKKAAQSAKEKAQRKGLQNSAADTTLRWLKEVQDSAARCAQSFDQLNASKDTQTKKLKLELQKAATIPVSQIASNSGSQLRDIFDKMDKLLSGRSVVSGGRSISTSQHPQSLDFVNYKLAEKFVKQGEEEVASHHEAAFPIGVVLSGIWELHPAVGELFLGHLHRKCPYAVPHYPPMKDGTSVDDYQRILGYRVDDSGVEGQDSFLKRMSGMIRLYAAVVQLRWPYNSKQGSVPHGLNHGWRWLAQMLNMEPLADVTATLLFDFLEVCGNALMKLYREQFWKLLLLLREQYFPRIEAVTSSGQMGSVIRLKEFLERALQSRDIRLPKGHLGPEFWRS